MSYPSGTLDLEKIKDALYDWIRTETNGVTPEVQILWRNQSEPLPPRPCVTLRIMDGPRPVGRDPSVVAQANGTFNAGMQHEMIVSVQVYGNTKIIKRPMAYQLAVDLNSSLLKQSVRIPLSGAGIGIQDLGAPANLTELEESEYEERAGFSMQLGVAQNVTDDPGTIETVNVQQIVGTTTRTKQITGL